MAKQYLGLIKTVGVTYDMRGGSEELEVSLRDFLSARGIEEMQRRNGLQYKNIEYDAEDMTVSWKKLEAEIEETFPNLRTRFTEGVEEEPWEDQYNNYEHLEISINE